MSREVTLIARVIKCFHLAQCAGFNFQEATGECEPLDGLGSVAFAPEMKAQMVSQIELEVVAVSLVIG